MKVAGVIFVAAAIFAVSALLGAVRLVSSDPAPAPIVLDAGKTVGTGRSAARASASGERFRARPPAEVRRRVERTSVSAYRAAVRRP